MKTLSGDSNISSASTAAPDSPRDSPSVSPLSLKSPSSNREQGLINGSATGAKEEAWLIRADDVDDSAFPSALGPLGPAFARLARALIVAHDIVYLAIHRANEPLVERLPRQIGGFTVFSANAVTYARFFLVFPLCALLRAAADEGLPAYSWTHLAAAGIVLFHHYLDILDGVVAKVQRRLRVAGVEQDCPRWGSFVDAQCDKLVFGACCGTLILLQVEAAEHPPAPGPALLVLTLLALSAVEATLFWVRVGEYMRSCRLVAAGGPAADLRAVSEGKLKQVLESLALALLCLGSPNHGEGLRAAAIATLWWAIWFALMSLRHKLKQNR